MYHIGLDVGSCKTCFCICQANGTIILEDSVKTAWLPRFFVEMAQARGKCRVVLESCAEAFTIGAWAVEAGHDVRIVPAAFARSLGIGEHGIKTDRRDARALALASCRVELRSIHIRSLASREILSATTARRTLVNCRTTTVNSVRGWLRTLVLSCGTGRVETFCKRVRETLKAAGRELPGFVESQLLVVESLNEQIKEVTKHLEAMVEADEVCQLLMSHPGVGPMTALEFRATIDEPTRFKHGDKVGSYIGITPGENTSSKRKRRTSITKAGSPELRRLLCQGAWSYWRTQEGMATNGWARQVAERRGKKVAMVALMRKMSVTLWAMWRHKEPYNAMHASTTNRVAA